MRPEGIVGIELSIEQRLKSLGYSLEPATLDYTYEPVSIHRHVAYVAGQIAKSGSRTVLHAGRVGEDVSLEQARECARLAVLNGFGRLKEALGTLDSVEAALRLTGYVASVPAFTQLSDVVDAATDMLGELLGPSGRCPRSVVGVSYLPFNSPVLLELTFAIRSAEPSLRPPTNLAD